jgi:hypothetical protein
MKQNEDFQFELYGKIYILKFEGIKPVLFNDGIQIERGVKTILRNYILENDLPISLMNNSNGVFLNTYQLGAEFQKYFGLKKSKTRQKKYINSGVSSELSAKKGNLGKIVIANDKIVAEEFLRHEKQYRTDIYKLIKEVESLVEAPKELIINQELFNPIEKYNKFIRENVDAKPGVYIWYDHLNHEVLYIGMAGKIKTNGELTNHPISERLQAYRCADKVTKSSITTNKYVCEALKVLNISEIKFFTLVAKQDEPAAFIESVLMYHYYKLHKVLPILNNAF